MQFMADLVLECESCHGKRFKNDTLEVKFEGKNIYDILEMTVNQAIEFFTEHNQKKIVKKLRPLQDVGLGYIKLGQSSSTLSGGENQRVKLAYFLSIEKAQPTIFVFMNRPQACISMTSRNCWKLSMPSSVGDIRWSSSNTTWMSSNAPTM